MRKYVIIYILIALFPLTGFAESADRGERLTETACKEILQKMARKLSVNKSLKARFVQERHLVLFGDVLRSEGFLYYQNPGRVRWEFTKPYGSITIMLENGEVEKFDVVDGRTVKVATGARKVLAEVLSQITNWQKGDMAQAVEEFDVLLYRGAKGKETGYTLILKPLAKGMAKILKQLEFKIDRDSFLAHSVSLRENKDDYTVIYFYEQKIDDTFPVDLFNLKKPCLVKDSEK